MSLTHETWRDELRAVATGHSHTSPRSLLNDSRSPNLSTVRWGAPLTNGQRIDFLAALCDEMRGASLDPAGNDQLEGDELLSLQQLITMVSQTDANTRGSRDTTAQSVLAAAELVFPYLDAFFAELNERANPTDIAQPA